MQVSFAQVRGFGSRQRIVLSPAFYAIPVDEQKAIIQHEIAHVAMRHQWQRIKWLVTGKWLDFRAWQAAVWAQEYDADEFAARAGHAPALIRFLQRRAEVESDIWHPPVRDRIEKLRGIHGSK